ncbi:MAG: GspE/PulE family protein, partial [Abditibacteriales bacterium]|nr:GspE/PulE family protein [Abditibacteriales bacterium]
TPRLLTRLKVVAKLTVYRQDAPQEGRLVAQMDDRSVDLRVTLLPTLHGERVTIRLFDPAHGPRALNELGMLPDMQQQFERLLARPQGTILFTGPANSGKTTTMYAALKHLHHTQQGLLSIATVEDPIEYDLQVINQTQINPASGLTFAAGLRTVLRQDPEVIMIGEIRDAETAEIAVRAGLTGHLILSTVHARSAPAVFVRLIEMGIEPFLVASSVTAVVAQRLVRVICPECRTSDQPDPDVLHRLNAPREAVSFQRGAGCEHCNGTGYRGRTGIFQILMVDDALRELMLRKASVPAFEQTVADRRAPTLLDDGWAKVKAGITTVEELERVGV